MDHRLSHLIIPAATAAGQPKIASKKDAADNTPIVRFKMRGLSRLIDK
jgi:hypothetical protein